MDTNFFEALKNVESEMDRLRRNVERMCEQYDEIVAFMRMQRAFLQTRD